MSLDQPIAFVKHQSVSHDAFLGGRLTVSQPRHGFRAGLDSVLLGAAVGEGRGELLDLGAGVGTAALVALTHHPHLAALLVEIDAAMLGFAQSNLANNTMAGRARAVPMDIVARGGGRERLPADHFGSVIANPPFFEREGGTLAPEPSRAGARHMPVDALDLWVRTAAGAAAPGGEVIFIHRAESLPDLLPAFNKRFGAITVLPLVPRPGNDASRVLVRGIKGSRAPMVLRSPLHLHGESGNAFTPPIEAILRGDGRLHW